MAMREVQKIRLMDVVVVGPLMMYGAVTSNMNIYARMILGIAGALTVFYNGSNFLSAQEEENLQA